MGNVNFFQYGPESVHGTAVAATKMIPAILPAIKPDRKPTFPREDAGVMADAVRAYTSGKLVRDNFKLDTLYWQSLPMLFSPLLKGGVTPAEQTADQDDYLWEHTPDLSAGADNEQDSLTLERGDNDFAVETEYVMHDRLKLSGTINQDGSDSSMSAEVSYFGRQNSTTTLTALTPQLGLKPINAKLAQIYLDSTWAGVGSTLKSLILRAWDIEIMSGLYPKSHGSGVEHFDEHGQGNMAFMASFTFHGDDTILPAIWAAMNSAALQVVRWKVTGPQIGSGDPYSLQLDLGGAWEIVTPLASKSNGGANLWTAVLRGYLDPVGEKMIQAQYTTNVSTI